MAFAIGALQCRQIDLFAYLSFVDSTAVKRISTSCRQVRCQIKTTGAIGDEFAAGADFDDWRVVIISDSANHLTLSRSWQRRIWIGCVETRRTDAPAPDVNCSGSVD